MTDHQIDLWMQKIVSGDTAALEALYRQMHEPIYFYALRISGDPCTAEDVMQETFVTVMRKASDYRAEGKGKAWLFRIAKNLTLDVLRRQNRSESFNVLPVLPTAEDFTVQSDTGIAALQMLDVLTPKEKNVVLLRLLCDMTLTQVAKELNVPRGTIFWIYNTAVRKMRNEFAGGETHENEI